MLKKQGNSNTNSAKPSDKTALFVWCGIVGLVLVGLVLIFVRRNKKTKH